jgi:peptidoglycan glycosyltransferase
LTLDAELQRLAQEALGEEAGAAVVLDASEGDVLAMVSAPTFDAAELEEEWEALREDPDAPLVNRATQGLYQPGSALQTAIVAEALAQGLVDDLTEEVGRDATEEVAVDGARVGCAVDPGAEPTLAEAYAAACPAAIGTLGRRLGEDGLVAAVERWRLTTPPSLTIPTEAADWTGEVISSTSEEAMGQGSLVVSPLQMALAAATVANEGTMVAPRLTLRVEDADGSWQETITAGEGQAVILPAEARTLLAAWRRWDDVPGQGLPGHWGVAVAGEGEPHAWFLGVSPSGGEGRYAVAVLLEHAEIPERAVEIGRQLLEAAQAR